MPKASDFAPFPPVRGRYSSARFQTEEPTIVSPRHRGAGTERETMEYAEGLRMRRDPLLTPLNRFLKFITYCVAFMLVAGVLLLAIHFRLTPCARNPRARNNLASSSLGAAVIPSLTSPALKITTADGTTNNPHTPEPAAALWPEFGADACWSFHGSEAQLGILLSKPAFLTNVSIGHVPRPTIAGAPRDVTMWGVVDGLENHQRFAQHSTTLKKLRMKLPSNANQPHTRYPLVPLASVYFDIRYGKPIQTFPIFREVVDMGLDFGIVVIKVHSNWGWNHTDVCHVGVFGDWIQTM